MEQTEPKPAQVAHLAEVSEQLPQRPRAAVGGPTSWTEFSWIMCPLLVYTYSTPRTLPQSLAPVPLSKQEVREGKSMQ